MKVYIAGYCMSPLLSSGVAGVVCNVGDHLCLLFEYVAQVEQRWDWDALIDQQGVNLCAKQNKTQTDQDCTASVNESDRRAFLTALILATIWQVCNYTGRCGRSGGVLWNDYG